MITWAIVSLIKAAMRDSRNPISGDLGCLIIMTVVADIVICVAAAIAIVAVFR